VNFDESMHDGALAGAASYGHHRTCRTLVRCKAEVNHQAARDGKTPLMRAAQFGHLHVVHTMLKNNANTELRGSRGDTALQLAAENGHERVVSTLLTSDYVDMTKLDIDDPREVDSYTPLMGAAAFGHVSVVNTLIKQGADVNYKRPKPYLDTALMRAAKFGRVDVVNVLLRSEVDTGTTVLIDHRDGDGCTALHLAIQSGYVDIVRSLVRAGANLNIYGTQMNLTPLMLACEAANEQIAQILVKQEKIQVALRNLDNLTALDLLNKATKANKSKTKPAALKLKEDLRKKMDEQHHIASTVPRLPVDA